MSLALTLSLFLQLDPAHLPTHTETPLLLELQTAGAHRELQLDTTITAAK